MAIYRYYQATDWDTWHIAADETAETPWPFAANHKAARVSVLALSSDPATPLPENTELTYCGPLYFDIDDHDLSVALHSGVSLCDKLVDMGVKEDDLEIHLSGVKGVHIFIHPNVFSKAKTQVLPHLPDAYAALALMLWVPGMDFQVYSKLKGRLVRPPNAPRDTGIFKIRVTLDELKGLDVDSYRELVKQPRQVAFPAPSCTWASGLNLLFEQALKNCKSDTKLGDTQRYPLIEESVLKNFGGGMPDCLNIMATPGTRRTGPNGGGSFNQSAIQLGCWTKSVNLPPPVLASYRERLVAANPSSKGESAQARLNKLVATENYVHAHDQYRFSCAAVKSLLNRTPACEGCAIHKQMQHSEGAREAALATAYVYSKAGSYFSDKDCTALVAPFSLKRDSYIINEETGQQLSSTMLLTVALTGKTHKILDFNEEAWLSKPNFKKEIMGIEGAGFLGNDNDVVRLKMTLGHEALKAHSEVTEVALADKIGINYRKVKGPVDPRHPDHRGRLTYVEPGFSMNDMGVPNTHELVVSTPCAPKLGARDFTAPVNAAANEAFALLLKMNTDDVLCMVLPWFFGSHIKQHLYQINERFPLLGISGNAGVGKNATVKVLMRLCGLEGEDAKWTLEAPNATKLPFQQNLSNSCTIPRVINEMNPKSMDNNHYRMVLEVLKAAYDSQVISKGTIGGGNRNVRGANVSTISWVITAPVVFLSEELISEPALVHRSVQIVLAGNYDPQYTDAFLDLEPRSSDLVDIGRSLIRSAIETPLKAICTLYDSQQLPKEVQNSPLQERIKVNFRTLLTAYDWAIPALGKCGMSEENLDGIRKLRQHFVEHITNNIQSFSTDSNKTEADKVMKDIALMAHAATNDMGRLGWMLQPGTHYHIEGDNLFLDTLTIYPKLVAYKGSNRVDGLRIHTEEAFISAVRSMPYFRNYGPVNERELPVGGRSVLTVSLDAMAAKGIAVSLFAGV